MTKLKFNDYPDLPEYLRRTPVTLVTPAKANSMLDLNRASLALEPINVSLNDAIEHAVVGKEEAPRSYLGAGLVGSECSRQVQLEWWRRSKHPARLQSIFARGHYFEEQSRQQLLAVGFKFASPNLLGFTAMDGVFRGHADGIIVQVPDCVELQCPCVWECKALNAKNFSAVKRDGLKKTFPKYAAQVALYQSYLAKTNPALFTAVNADTCERLHFLVPFDAECAQLYSDRAVMIIEATRANELLPRAFDESDWRCGVCPQKTYCWGRET